MINEKAIRDRFILLLKQVESENTLKEIAKKIGCSDTYLSQLKKKPNPQIPGSYIANFCESYNYNPSWILTGKGEKKTKVQKSKEDKLIEIIAKLMEQINKKQKV